MAILDQRKLLVGAIMAGVAAFGVSSPVSAQDRVCEGSGELGSDECDGVDVESGELQPIPVPPSVTPGPQNPSTGVTEDAAASLPVTGTETGMLALAGVALVGGGAVLVTRSRKIATA